MFIPKGPFCQSCGMPLSEDPKAGGTESNGNQSTVYCSFCYQDGKFTEPNLTLEQMIEKCQGMMREMKLPNFIVKAAPKRIAQLKRWQNK